MKAKNLEYQKKLYNKAIEKAEKLDKPGSYEKAAFAYLHARKLLEKDLAFDLKAAAICLVNSGNCYLNAENYQRAEFVAQQVLQWGKKHLPKSDLLIGVALNYLMIVFLHKKELDKAGDYGQQALLITQDYIDSEPLIVADSLHNLGLVYFDKGELDKAQKYTQKTYDLLLKTLGNEHPDIAGSLNNLAAIYASKNEYELAQDLWSQADSINNRLLGGNHKDTKIVINNIRLLNTKISRLEQENLKQKAALHQSKKLEYLGQMATMMAHNINNPVGIIRMIASGALGDLNDKLFNPETELKLLLEKIIAQTERLSIMMANFRKFSKGDRQKLSAVNLNELIEDIFQLLFDASYQIDKINTNKDFFQPAPIAYSNEFALQEMLISLLSNARAAVQEQEIKTIRISTWQDQNSVGFTLEDSGVGVSAEQEPQLFTPFLSSKSEGMGLGLYFCREIVNDLGGSIEYFPSALGGAGFKISLAIQQEKSHGVSI